MSKHVDLKSIENYVRNNKYPDLMKEKGLKRNFRKACAHFSLVDGHLEVAQLKAFETSLVTRIGKQLGYLLRRKSIVGSSLVASFGRESRKQTPFRICLSTHLKMNGSTTVCTS